MTVAGYRFDRDEEGLTSRERSVLALIQKGLTFAQIGKEMGVSRQRVGQIATALVKKQRLIRQDGRYGLAFERNS